MYSAKSKGQFATIIGVRRAAILTLAGALIAASVSACGNRDDTAPLIASAIAITTPSGEITAAGTTQFTATVTDASGATIAVNPTWTVVNGGGTITSDGLFTAGDSAGTFVNTIQATIGSVTSTITVTVSAGALASIAVTPATISLSAGATQLFVAIGKDAHGNVVAIPNRVWAVAAMGGTIDTSGLFTAGTASGSFVNTVTATSTSVAGSASVTVVAGPLASLSITPASASIAIGMTQQYALVGHDANGNIVPVDPAPTWSASAGGAIDANGLFTAGTVAGTFANTIQARANGILGTASVIVLAGAPTTITVTPSDTTVNASALVQYTAVVTDANGNVKSNTVPVWTVVSGGGTISSPSGSFFSGTTPGSFPNTVHATLGSVVGTASVTVRAATGPLASIVITPANPTIDHNRNNPLTFTATGYDAANNVVPIPNLVWSVNPAVGQIFFDGTLNTDGNSDGFFLNAVTATSGSIVAHTSVTTLCGC